MATARVWIFDSRQPQFLKKRKNTLYIQTWHGTPLKKLALDMEDVFMSGESGISDYKEKFVENVRTWDYLISQNPFSTEVFRRAFDFKGEMLEIGYPRNDVLFSGNTPEHIWELKEKLGLPKDKKILLYAPTWRDDEFLGNNCYRFQPKLSFERMQEELSGEYVMIVKYHYLIMDAVDWSGYENFVYTFDQSRDIAELFLVADALITDYSSVMFDYSILKRPQYFFAYDLEKYRDKLRGFYFDYEEEMPGPVVRTTEALIDAIKSAEPESFKERYLAFCDKYNGRDNGTASEQICRLVSRFIRENKGGNYGDNS
jgi:CDP-glycerol glycerophosphotransferase